MRIFFTIFNPFPLHFQRSDAPTKQNLMDAAAASRGKFDAALDGGDISLGSSISSGNNIVTAANSMNMGVAAGADKKANLMKELFG